MQCPVAGRSATVGARGRRGVPSLDRQQGRGFRIAKHVIPIVPGAIMFEMIKTAEHMVGAVAPYSDSGLHRGGGGQRQIRAGRRRDRAARPPRI